MGEDAYSRVSHITSEHTHIQHMNGKKQIKMTGGHIRSIFESYLNEEKKILAEGMADGGNIRQDFMQWAMNEADKMRRIGGPINAVELMYDYYCNNDEEALYGLLEGYAEARHLNIEGDEFNSVKAEIVKAINEWGYYNAGDIENNLYGEAAIREAAKTAIMEMVAENRRRHSINEGAYGYPDCADQIIIASENDRECYDRYSQIARALAKHKKRGTVLSVNQLANSSVMKDLQQLAFRKFKKYQGPSLTSQSPAVYRSWTADFMIKEVNDGQWD